MLGQVSWLISKNKSYMKRVLILTTVLLTITMVTLNYFGFFGCSGFDSGFGKLVMCVLLVVAAVLCLGLSHAIFDNISLSKKELTGKIIDKNTDEQRFATPITICKITTYVSNSRTAYNLSIKTSDGNVYKVECSKEEHEAAHNDDVNIFIEDIRKSGLVYYYTK